MMQIRSREIYYNSTIYAASPKGNSQEALEEWADPSTWTEEDGAPPRSGDRLLMRDWYVGETSPTEWYGVTVQ